MGGGCRGSGSRMSSSRGGGALPSGTATWAVDLRPSSRPSSGSPADHQVERLLSAVSPAGLFDRRAGARLPSLKPSLLHAARLSPLIKREVGAQPFQIAGLSLAAVLVDELFLP